MSDDQTYSAAAEVGQIKLQRSRFKRSWIELKKAPPTAWFGLIMIIIYGFVAIFAPWLAPFGEADSSFS